MLSKFIAVGDKIELQPVDRKKGEIPKTYHSTVQDILSEDTLEIAMPIEQNQLILLPVGGEYDLVFLGETGTFQCFARVTKRYKTNNLYFLVVELTSNLRKNQRREYYRFSCVLEMCARNLEEAELQSVQENKEYMFQAGLPLRNSVIVDISGGGLRFISEQRFEPDSYIYCSYHLIKGGERKKYELVSKVLAARELDNRPGTFEHRVQYYNLDSAIREEIIKFIFEEERKSRKKENFL